MFNKKNNIGSFVIVYKYFSKSTLYLSTMLQFIYHKCKRLYCDFCGLKKVGIQRFMNDVCLQPYTNLSSIKECQKLLLQILLKLQYFRHQ